MTRAMSGQHKLIVNGQMRAELLPPADANWSAEDWRARYDQRARNREHIRGLSRVDAQREAFQSCIAEWFNANPSPSPSGRCAWCGKVQAGALLLPFGTEPATHAWLHADCWSAWHQGRRAEAAKSLANMEVIEPQTDGAPHNLLAASHQARS